MDDIYNPAKAAAAGGGGGHSSIEVYFGKLLRSGGKSSIICHYCKKTGHEVAQCYAKHGYLDRWGNSPCKWEVYGDLRPGQRLGGTAGSVVTRGAAGTVQDGTDGTILVVFTGACPRQQTGEQVAGGSISTVAHGERFPSISSDQWNKLMSLLGTISSNTPLDNTRLMGECSLLSWIIDIGATIHATGSNYQDSDWSG
ncbi:hypothetical protein LIER_07141 [Lithospermum erythrorhizon]|uniref:Uncharacterized protein n=1 Tax=Lithospermum erythrorhizon TaxID=34254 RepID=A0AAV3P832_LITER